MWNFILAFFTAQAVGRSRFVRVVLFVFLLGALVAGIIYAAAVFNAVHERNLGHVQSRRSL